MGDAASDMSSSSSSSLLAALDGKSRAIKLFMRDYDYEMMVMAAQGLDL